MCTILSVFSYSLTLSLYSCPSLSLWVSLALCCCSYLCLCLQCCLFLTSCLVSCAATLCPWPVPMALLLYMCVLCYVCILSIIILCCHRFECLTPWLAQVLSMATTMYYSLPLVLLSFYLLIYLYLIVYHNSNRYYILYSCFILFISSYRLRISFVLLSVSSSFYLSLPLVLFTLYALCLCLAFSYVFILFAILYTLYNRYLLLLLFLASGFVEARTKIYLINYIIAKYTLHYVFVIVFFLLFSITFWLSLVGQIYLFYIEF